MTHLKGVCWLQVKLSIYKSNFLWVFMSFLTWRPSQRHCSVLFISDIYIWKKNKFWTNDACLLWASRCVCISYPLLWIIGMIRYWKLKVWNLPYFLYWKNSPQLVIFISKKIQSPVAAAWQLWKKIQRFILNF